MFAIYKKELNTFFSSIIGYVVMAIFLVVMWLLLWMFPNANNIIDNKFAALDGFFNIVPQIFIFLIPAITMRSFAEENQTGTIELLATKPLKDWEIVVGKFLANWTLVV
ncbi:MAG: gliding motility-associated transporter permease subunit GldF, partial [Bacteroidota bacterium]